MATFYISDTHFGHKNISKLAGRPFDEVTDMNEVIVARWNSVVGADDTVYHLGDVALGSIRESLEYIKRLNGSKVLIIGNHDRCFAGTKRSGGLEPDQWEQVYLDAGFVAVLPNATHRVSDVTFELSHFPYSGDSHADARHQQFRLEDRGIPIVHGHTHSKERVTFSEKGTKQVHVGVDAWDFYPVHESQVLDLLG